MLLTGEWKARFDPRFTSRGVFYLDDMHMVDVEVMEDAKHPLSLFIDSELEAQVKCSLVISYAIFFFALFLSVEELLIQIHCKRNSNNYFHRYIYFFPLYFTFCIVFFLLSFKDKYTLNYKYFRSSLILVKIEFVKNAAFQKR